MGQHNRQRRAAKQRQRGHKQRGRSTRPRPFSTDSEYDVFATGAATLFLGRALRQLMRGGEAPFDLLDFQRCAEPHQQAAVDEQFSFAVDRLIAAGWTPLDLFEVMRRKTGSAAISHLLDVVAEATARHPARLVHPEWRAQLEHVGAAVQPTGGASPARSWGGRLGLEWTTALEELLAVLVVVCSLPAVESVLPAPGSRSEPVDGDGEAGVDAKVLRRVRGLLAKAESTEHPEEADALTAKAQQLMTRHAIERVVAESSESTAPAPVCRRLWLDSPYVDAKALLVESVADANNCRAIQSVAWGFVTVVGHRGDLDAVELLVTSLLLQATRAMTLAGSQTTRHGGSRTRSFRRSFLVAYGTRIGERLTSSAVDAEADYESHNNGVLVPVLAAHRARVDDKVGELFPNLIEREISVSNAAGWGAGRAAADLARLDIHDAIDSRAG